MKYRWPSERSVQVEGVTYSFSDPRDISAMKLSAIASCGTKRDFVDLYVLSKRYGFTELVRIFRQKFARVPVSEVHLMKSVVYFADADKEPMPDMLQPLKWEEVKQFFLLQVPRLKK